MNNPYSLLLKEYISQSGLSLTEIEYEMRKRGLSKNKAYLSSLQNGKMPPPPLNVTHALCDITGGDPLRLSLTGVLMEISEQDFFLINKDKNKVSSADAIKEIIVTTIATLMDINKYKLSRLFSDSFIKNGIELTEEDALEALTYNDAKEVLYQIMEGISLSKIIKEGTKSLEEEAEEIVQHTARNIEIKFEEKGQTVSGILKEKTTILDAIYLEDEVSDEEFDYMLHCLVVYRKLNLKPIK
ncbi:hypothetical protein DZB84_20595 [Bacillus sp. HNG]|uniref:hypothetical protein n=1 Tax=Bacillus sp. HNG TaxID=2293325 RepID=UPI000E2EF4BD|nr:hypothetical protein [Bacillus sp. HNG]RFB11468.1 hypothetical protein DZB84_20595 [Bacillus sp. HNG]